MKTKRIIATALLTAGLGLSAISTNANALSWHKGTPRVLRGYWDNNKAKDELQISSKLIYVIPYGGASVSPVKSIKYRYVGYNTYQYKQGLYTGKIKLSTNHHYVKFQGISGLFAKK